MSSGRGSPNWRAFAVRVFHTRFVAGYFALLYRVEPVRDRVGRRNGPHGSDVGRVAYAGRGLALGFLGVLAWLFARTTVYTLTNRRIAMRYGVALPMTINIPLRCIGRRGCGLSQRPATSPSS